MLRKSLLLIFVPLAGIWLVLFALDYNRRPDIEKLRDYFQQHAGQFQQLANDACEAKQRLGFNFYSYPAAPVFGVSGEPQQDALLDQTLAAALADGFLQYVVVEGKTCTVTAIAWDSGFAGEGQAMGYVYQPAKIDAFIAAKHAKGQRDFSTELTFTIPLGAGWYIYYHNEP